MMLLNMSYVDTTIHFLYMTLHLHEYSGAYINKS